MKRLVTALTFVLWGFHLPAQTFEWSEKQDNFLAGMGQTIRIPIRIKNTSDRPQFFIIRKALTDLGSQQKGHRQIAAERAEIAHVVRVEVRVHDGGVARERDARARGERADVRAGKGKLRVQADDFDRARIQHAAEAVEVHKISADIEDRTPRRTGRQSPGPSRNSRRRPAWNRTGC